MLSRAVCDYDEDPERTAEILDSLRLTGSSWAGGGAPIAHAESLRKSDVASLSESRDTQTLLGTQKLVLVGEIDIGNAHHGIPHLFIINSPIESWVLLPIEVSDVSDPVCEDILMNSPKHFFLIDLDGKKGLYFIPDAEKR